MKSYNIHTERHTQQSNNIQFNVKKHVLKLLKFESRIQLLKIGQEYRSNSETWVQILPWGQVVQNIRDSTNKKKWNKTYGN